MLVKLTTWPVFLPNNHSSDFSYAKDTLKTELSSYGLPTICMPVGMLFEAKPVGTLQAT